MEYRVEDTVTHRISASLGALVEATTTLIAFRRCECASETTVSTTPTIFIRTPTREPLRSGRLPLDDNYMAFRHVFWLATDRAFKTAEESIARKRSSLKNMNLPDPLPDFSKAPPAHLIFPIQRKPFALDAWKKEIVVFRLYLTHIRKFIVRRGDADIAVHELRREHRRHDAAVSGGYGLCPRCRRRAWRPMGPTSGTHRSFKHSKRTNCRPKTN